MKKILFSLVLACGIGQANAVLVTINPGETLVADFSVNPAELSGIPDLLDITWNTPAFLSSLNTKVSLFDGGALLATITRPHSGAFGQRFVSTSGTYMTGSATNPIIVLICTQN